MGKITTLIVYVNDMIIIGDDVEEISRLQEKLTIEFEMKNFGGLKYFFRHSSSKVKTRHISFPKEIYTRLVGRGRITKV